MNGKIGKNNSAYNIDHCYMFLKMFHLRAFLRCQRIPESLLQFIFFLIIFLIHAKLFKRDVYKTNTRRQVWYERLLIGTAPCLRILRLCGPCLRGGCCQRGQLSDLLLQLLHLLGNKSFLVLHFADSGSEVVDDLGEVILLGEESFVVGPDDVV